jgi:hypothetical protein
VRSTPRSLNSIIAALLLYKASMAVLSFSGSLFSVQSFCRLYPIFGLLFPRMIMKNAIEHTERARINAETFTLRHLARSLH